MTKKYAGIGSRASTLEVNKLIRSVANILKDDGYICHTGGALGSDKAFIDGAGQDNCVLWLPWQGYNNYYSDAPEITQKHLDFTSKYHPNWKRCRDGARKMHARNSQILLGNDLNDPVEFVVCWTLNGEVSGGTAQGLRIAMDYDIPIFNLGHSKTALNSLKEFLYG